MKKTSYDKRPSASSPEHSEAVREALEAIDSVFDPAVFGRKEHDELEQAKTDQRSVAAHGRLLPERQS